jgi:hypothetical protein
MATADTLPMPIKPLPIAPKGSASLLTIVQHLRDYWDLGDLLVRSRLLPSTITTPEAAVAIMLRGQELGFGPMRSFDQITVISGRTTLSPQGMLAKVYESGFLEDLQVEETQKPYSCRITVKRVGQTPQVVTFDEDEARAMQLFGKDNYKKQPGVMIYWRCVAKAFRRVFPDVIAGCYTPEEMGAEVNEDGEILDVEAVPAKLPPPVPSAKGLFTKEHVQRTQVFCKWLGDKCREVNREWHEGDGEEDGWPGWKATLEKALEDGHEVPEKVADVMPYQKARGHLWKWGIAQGYIAFEPGVDVEEAKTRQIDAYVSLVAFEHKAELKAELDDYIARERDKACDAIYRKNPDLAPVGWGEVDDEPEVIEAEVVENKGDAYEDDLPPADPPSQAASVELGGPRNGRELFAWIKQVEQQHEVGMLRYVNSWAKLQEFPGRMVDWDSDQVALAYQEAARKLKAIEGDLNEGLQEALAN